ncbi:MAG TPA: class I SAM-dependent methyltransferase [Methylomirabilota bacterium]|nr:class I SAM-dependent methyltransferase [Methylomirabilota bacterium]
MKEELEKQARFFELGESYFWLSGQNTLVERTLAPYLERRRAQVGGRPLQILDLGCGPGNTLRRLMRWGTVVGSDYSLDALAFARTKGISRVLSCDSTALPFALESFDCVVALDMLEHVEDDEAAMLEIRRILCPGGVFLFSVPASMALWRHHDVMYGHFRRYSKRDLRARVERAALVISECRFFKCAFYPPLWVLAKTERLLRNVVSPRDNFYRVPGWLNRLLEAEIVWEDRLRLTRLLPFGVSIICVGHR